MEKRTGTVNPPIIMNTFVNEAFEDEGDDNIVENNNSGWGNVNLDAVLKHAGDIDKTKMSALLNIPGNDSDDDSDSDDDNDDDDNDRHPPHERPEDFPDMRQGR